MRCYGVKYLYILSHKSWIVGHEQLCFYVYKYIYHKMMWVDLAIVLDMSSQFV